MSDSLMQPDTNPEEEPQIRQALRAATDDEQDVRDKDQPEPEADNPEDEETTGGQTEAARKSIWTPTFISLFTLTLIIGISTESLLTTSWLSQLLYINPGVILVHVLLVALGWLVLSLVSRSPWIRIGCMFGGIWAAFMLFDIFLNAQGINQGSPVLSYINAATSMALLGTYLGLSINGTLRTRWDILLLLLIPVLGSLGVLLTYMLTPQASLLTIENATAVAALVSCCCCWWLRPSCWKIQPGPTFLFGVVPAILLAVATTNTSIHNLFLLQTTYIMEPGTVVNSNNFFFAQLILLSLLLGCLRLTRSEQKN